MPRDRYVQSVEQVPAPGKWVLLSSSKWVRADKRDWINADERHKRYVKLDVRDLGGHVDPLFEFGS